MLNSYFCNQTPIPLLCSWSWKIIVIFVLGFLIWKIISPKKEDL